MNTNEVATGEPVIGHLTNANSGESYFGNSFTGGQRASDDEKNPSTDSPTAAMTNGKVSTTGNHDAPDNIGQNDNKYYGINHSDLHGKMDEPNDMAYSSHATDNDPSLNMIKSMARVVNSGGSVKDELAKQYSEKTGHKWKPEKSMTAQGGKYPIDEFVNYFYGPIGSSEGDALTDFLMSDANAISSPGKRVKSIFLHSSPA